MGTLLVLSDRCESRIHNVQIVLMGLINSFVITIQRDNECYNLLAFSQSLHHQPQPKH
jgi:hypothetical protein